MVIFVLLLKFEQWPLRGEGPRDLTQANTGGAEMVVERRGAEAGKLLMAREIRIFWGRLGKL